MIQLRDMAMTTWREELKLAMREHGETLDDIVESRGREGWMDIVRGGVPFTAWTKDRVWFPAMYDGNEWAASAPRNPCDEITKHIGG